MDRSKIRKLPNAYDVEWEVAGFHWWFAARRRLLKSILSFINVPINSVTLDMGCGTGSNLNVLASAGLYGIGLDRSMYALTLVRKQGMFPLLAGNLNNLPIKAKSVGLIIAMDILEHLDDDANGIKEFYRVLNGEGILILTVPAFNYLWGIQDDVTGHKRRYSRKEIMNKLREAGFQIIKASYFNFFLFFPILFGRRIIRILGFKVESENKINAPFVNFVLKAIFSLEPCILRYFSFPFGVSILCIAKKSSAP